MTIVFWCWLSMGKNTLAHHKCTAQTNWEQQHLTDICHHRLDWELHGYRLILGKMKTPWCLQGKNKDSKYWGCLVRRRSGNGRTRIHTGTWTPEYHTALLPTSGRQALDLLIQIVKQCSLQETQQAILFFPNSLTFQFNCAALFQP